VTFTHDEDVFTVVIRTSPGGANVRRLENRGPTCSALAQAAAVTLAILFDSDVGRVAPPATSDASPSPIASVPLVVPPPERPKRRLDAFFAIGAVGLAGVLRPVAPAALADGGIAAWRWRLSVGALWGFSETFTLGPGTVRETLLSGLARGCYTPVRGESLRFDLCSGAYLGLMTGEARGYSRNDIRTRPWFAVPIELALASPVGPVAWELSGGALLPLRRQNFSIDGVGIAYASPSVGAVLSLRAIALLPW
jgi:hypothetical protein